jgi:hypothetical protein
MHKHKMRALEPLGQDKQNSGARVEVAVERNGFTDLYKSTPAGPKWSWCPIPRRSTEAGGGQFFQEKDENMGQEDSPGSSVYFLASTRGNFIPVLPSTCSI